MTEKAIQINLFSYKTTLLSFLLNLTTFSKEKIYIFTLFACTVLISRNKPANNTDKFTID